MTFEQWREGEQWNDHCNPTDFAKAAWDYQQARIDKLSRLAETAYDHGYTKGYADGKQDA